MMKRVMRRAVNLAKNFEGDWQARMSEALKISWALEKEESVVEIVQSDVNEWKNYGHHRVYIEGKMVVYIDAWGSARAKEISFKGYYDMKKANYIMQGGDDRYKNEIFSALKEINRNFKPAEKTSGLNFIRAKYDGYDAETGEVINVGDPIFYCEANNGYCLAHNA